mmetsp:Transcript_19684/g.54663  ORF Transcript_19684/g.54663 Transcript_19684/m.54663 type:complete len:350 (-) Transcript_19684:80-1129(-)
MDLPEDVLLEDLPLSQLYERASSISSQAESLAGGKGANSKLQEAVSWLEAASRRIDGLGMFSTNETAEDIATGDLKYLLLSYYKGELHANMNFPADPGSRTEAVLAAVASYSAFLGTCDRCELLGESKASLEQEEVGRTDPTTARAHKIARFKREKAIKAQLEQFKKKRMEQMRSAALGAYEDDEGGDLIAGVDEEEERRAWELQIELAVQKAMETRKMLREEVKILSHMAQMPPEARAAPSPAPPSEILEGLRKAASGLSERERRKGEVFRPGHALPTMSLAELGEKERAEALQRQRAEGELEARRQQRLEELGSDEDEEELLRQRAMDDWKDDNPRGSGNSRLKPCA